MYCLKRNDENVGKCSHKCLNNESNDSDGR